MGLFDSLFGDPPKPKTPKTPKADPAIKRAAQKGAELGQDYLDFAKDQFKVSQERQSNIDALTKQVSDFFLNVAQSDRATYEKVYRPLEEQFAKTAQEYASPERQEQEAAKAKADVETQTTLQRGAAERNAAAIGVSPASGRYAGIDRAIGLGTALGSVDAQNRARAAVRDKGLALQHDAINVGKGTNASAISAGSAAASPVLSANAQWQNTPGIVTPGYSAAMTGQGGVVTGLGNLYNTAASVYGTQSDYASDIYGIDTKMAAANAEGTGALLGQVAGAALPMILSDKKAKTDRKKVPEGKSLEAVDEMPVETFNYKPGAGDGARHVGPMAQDFKKATGKGDGKTIQVQDVIGLTLGAVKDLSKKVDRIIETIGIGGRARALAPASAAAVGARG